MQKKEARAFVLWYVQHHHMDVYDFVMHAWIAKHSHIPEVEKIEKATRFILDDEYMPSYVIDHCKALIGDKGIPSPMYAIMPENGGRN